MNIVIRKNSPSGGASALREALREAGHSCVFSQLATFRRRSIIINWGMNSDVASAPEGSIIINPQQCRRVATNKITALAAMQAAGVPVPPWWTSASGAREWRDSQPVSHNPIVLARSTATGEGGEGIQVVRASRPIPNGMPLYTAYVRKANEYRVHVINGEAVAFQQKRFPHGAELTSPDGGLIRNHSNGWVFAVDSFDGDREALGAVAVRAVAACGLQLGAVDIISPTRAPSEYVVLEVNTRPGLESPTVLSSYVDAFRRMGGGL